MRSKELGECLLGVAGRLLDLATRAVADPEGGADHPTMPLEDLELPEGFSGFSGQDVGGGCERGFHGVHS